MRTVHSINYPHHVISRIRIGINLSLVLFLILQTILLPADVFAASQHEIQQYEAEQYGNQGNTNDHIIYAVVAGQDEYSARQTEEPYPFNSSELPDFASLSVTLTETVPFTSTVESYPAQLTLTTNQTVIHSDEQIQLTASIATWNSTALSDSTLTIEIPTGLKSVDDSPPQWQLPKDFDDVTWAQTILLELDSSMETQNQTFEIQARLLSKDGDRRTEATLTLGYAGQYDAFQNSVVGSNDSLETTHGGDGATIASEDGTVTLLASSNAAKAGTLFRYTPTYRWEGTVQARPSQPDNSIFLPFWSDGEQTMAQSYHVPEELNRNANKSQSIFVDEEPLWDQGIQFYQQWTLDALLNESEVEQFDGQVKLMVSASWLAERGLDVQSLRLWTRNDENDEWRVVQADYAPETEQFTAWLSHFSQFGLGEGLTQDVMLPSLTGFNHDLFTGSVNASVPIVAPSGLGGMSPDISLSYSSLSVEEVKRTSGDFKHKHQAGIAGLGWEISGLSHISKVKEDEGEVYFLVLNGTKVRVSEEANWTSPSIFAHVQYNRYSPESDGTSRLRNIGTWDVITSDGTKYRYGRHIDFEGTVWPREIANTAPYQTILRYSNSKAQQAVSKWFLSEVVDPLGNRMVYEYDNELESIPRSCLDNPNISGDDLPSEDRFYIRSTRPTQIYWSGNGNEDLMMRLRFAYQDGRSDADIEGRDERCNQAHYSTKRLAEVAVEVRTAPNTGEWHTVRSYQLEHTHLSGDNEHLMLNKVHQYGKDDAERFKTYTFGYGNVPVGASTRNNIRLTSVDNGQGGVKHFQYNPNGLVTYCGGSNCGDSYTRFPLVRTITEDGVGNGIQTTYNYGETPKARSEDGVYEFMGYRLIDVISHEKNEPETILKQERFLYHQGTPANPTPLQGRLVSSNILNPDGTSLRTASTEWIALTQLSDGRWEETNTHDAYPLWIRKKQDRILQDAKHHWTDYFYEPERQNGYQFGNVTRVDERTILNVLRSTTTEYFPNVDKHIVSLPARMRVYEGVPEVGQCLSEERTVYGADNLSNGFNTIPTSPLAVKSEQAIVACSDAPTVESYDLDWAITHTGYDTYGNVRETKVLGHQADGSEDKQVTTTVDPTYHLFPIARQRPNVSGYIERASYYGVNNVFELSDPGTVWGAMAQHCDINELCTRQKYDSFGRPIEQWTRVPQGTPWEELGDSDHAWSYVSAEVSGQSANVITQKSQPSCQGNFKRSLYNGLGQLIQTQQPDEDWRRIEAGCSEVQIGDEIAVDYEYDGVGRQSRVSPPHTISRYVGWPNDLLRPAQWQHGFTRTKYDRLDRPVRVIAPNGEESRTEYEGYKVKQIGVSPDGSEQKMLRWQEFNRLGHLTNVRSYKFEDDSWTTLESFKLTHNAVGHLLETELDTQHAVTMAYDLAGRKLSMNDPDLGEWFYTYDREGRLISQTDARGCVTTHSYDSRLGRITGRSIEAEPGSECSQLGETPDLTYRYDENHSVTQASRGQLTSVAYADGRYEKQLSYNTKGLLASETVQIEGAPAAYTTQYHYDAYDRLTTTIYPDGEAVTQSYNSMGLADSLTASSQPLADDLRYDVAGRLTEMRLPAGNNLQKRWSYGDWSDNGGRLAAIQVGSSSGSSLLDLQYHYDAFGNVQRLTEDGTVHPDFAYDGQNRLLSAFGHSYTWDASGNGNLATFEGKPYGYDLDHIHAVQKVFGEARYAYDANGNMTIRNKDVSGEEQQLRWDRENRLQSMTGDSLFEQYLYDPEGIRIKKSNSEGSHYYVNDLFEVHVPAGAVAHTSVRAASEVGGDSTARSTTLVSANLLINGDFESDSGWTLISDSGGAATSYARRDNGVTSGIQNSFGAVLSNHASGSLKSDPIAIEAGTPYKLSVRLHGELDAADSAGAWQVGVHFFDANGQSLGTQDVASSDTVSLIWQAKSGTFVPPVGAATLRIRLTNDRNSGWVTFDRIELKKNSTGANLVANHSFEEEGGWTEVPNTGYPATSFFSRDWGTPKGYPLGNGYALSNHAFGAISYNELIPIEAGKYHYLSAYVRGVIDADESSGLWYLRVEYLDASGSLLGFKDATSSNQAPSSWTKRLGLFRPPTGATHVQIKLLNQMNSGWVAFDDVQLYTLTSPRQYLLDSGFENPEEWTVGYGSGDFLGTSIMRGHSGIAAGRSGHGYVIHNLASGLLQSDAIPVEVGETYNVSVSLHGKIDADESEGGWAVNITFFDAVNQSIDTEVIATGLAAPADWEEKSHAVVAPSGSAFMKVELAIETISGWVAFDNIAVTKSGDDETPPAPNAPPVTITKYYHLNGQRIANRKVEVGGSSALYYLHNDHLGSTSLVTNESGEVQSSQRHRAYGGVRIEGGELLTDHTFTGQKVDGTGMIYYRARYYDPDLGTFISPDTIVPDPGLVLDYNRYAYTRGNPLKYSDPSGHIVETVWDAANVAIGVGSLGYNLWHGNWGDAALDAGGLVLDVGATVIPVIPGGAATAIKAGRAANAAVDAGRSLSKIDNVIDGIKSSQSLSSKSVVYSGHGIYEMGSGFTTVPDGTRALTYSKLGGQISDKLGNAIETGKLVSPEYIDTYYKIWEPGSRIPNYTLLPPVNPDLNIVAHANTVETATKLSDLLEPNMGTFHWAACTDCHRALWSGQVWDVNHVWFDNLPK